MKVDRQHRSAQKRRREERREKRWARVLVANLRMGLIETAYERRQSVGRTLRFFQALQAAHAALVHYGNPEHRQALSEIALELQQERDRLPRRLGWDERKVGWALRMLARDKRLRRQVLEPEQVKE
jgi:hypothetical protein